MICFLWQEWTLVTNLILAYTILQVLPKIMSEVTFIQAGPADCMWLMFLSWQESPKFMIYSLCYRLGRQEADILDTAAIVNLFGISFFSHTGGYFHTSSIHHFLLNPISLIGRFNFPVGLCQYCVAVNTLRHFFKTFLSYLFFLTQKTID